MCAELAEQTYLISLSMGHPTREAKVAWLLSTQGNLGTAFSEKATKPLAVLAAPNSYISRHPRRLPIRSISAECLVNFRERHEWKHCRKRCDADDRIATYDEAGLGKLENMNRLGHGAVIDRNANVRNGSKADIGGSDSDILRECSSNPN